MTTEAPDRTEISGLNVNDIVLRWPGTVAVFARHDIDSCCGGGISVAVAARKHGVPLEELLEEIRAVAEES